MANSLVFEQLVSSTIVYFCRANLSWYKNARAAGLKRITFIVAPTTPVGQPVNYPGFFTFRVRYNFRDDLIFLRLFNLIELALFLVFDITKFGYRNGSIHVFFVQDKFVGRLKGSTVTAKSGRTEASESWEREARPARLILKVQKS
jgi:hypothetical protein